MSRLMHGLSKKGYSPRGVYSLRNGSFSINAEDEDLFETYFKCVPLHSHKQFWLHAPKYDLESIVYRAHSKSLNRETYPLSWMDGFKIYKSIVE
jgi:hypothetical protein